jgi:hypothetical protein
VDRPLQRRVHRATDARADQLDVRADLGRERRHRARHALALGVVTEFKEAQCVEEDADAVERLRQFLQLVCNRDGPALHY